METYCTCIMTAARKWDRIPGSQDKSAKNSTWTGYKGESLIPYISIKGSLFCWTGQHSLGGYVNNVSCPSDSALQRWGEVPRVVILPMTLKAIWYQLHATSQELQFRLARKARSHDIPSSDMKSKVFYSMVIWAHRSTFLLLSPANTVCIVLADVLQR